MISFNCQTVGRDKLILYAHILVDANGHGSDDFLRFDQMYVLLFMTDDVVDDKDTRCRIDNHVFVHKQTVAIHLSGESEKKFRF